MNTQHLTLPFLTALMVFSISLTAQNKVNQQNLEALMNKAETSHSSAIVIYHNGKLIKEHYAGIKSTELIECMSVTKSIASLAIGLCLTQGLLDSVTQPVHTIFPEWKQGQKQFITIKHLLNHTSGLQNDPSSSTTQEVYPSPNVVRLALAAELQDAVGSKFSYNNKATNLIAGIVQKVSGQAIDQFMNKHLFQPLGIKNYQWMKDPAGNPRCMDGFRIAPKDLAKIGQLVLQNGIWEDQQLIHKAWIHQSTQPSQKLNPAYGLLWWVVTQKTTYVIDDEQLEKISKLNLPTDFLEKLQQAKGEYHSRLEFMAMFERVFGENWKAILREQMTKHQIQISKKFRGTPDGFAANGYLGQYLVVYPEKKLVGVRMIVDSDAYDNATDEFSDFQDMLYQLLK